MRLLSKYFPKKSVRRVNIWISSHLSKWPAPPKKISVLHHRIMLPFIVHYSTMWDILSEVNFEVNSVNHQWMHQCTKIDYLIKYSLRNLFLQYGGRNWKREPISYGWRKFHRREYWFLWLENESEHVRRIERLRSDFSISHQRCDNQKDYYQTLVF